MEQRKQIKNDKTFTCTVDWYKSRMWGYCPRIEGYTGTEWHKSKASGCGYDKPSTVFAQYLNACPEIVEKMQELTAWDKENRPYGFSNYKSDPLTADGGVGISSLLDGLKAIGLTVIHTSGESSDHFTISGDFTARKSLTFVDYRWKDSTRTQTGSIHEFNAITYKDDYTIIKKYSRRVRGEK